MNAKSVLVTGATSGIGEAIAQSLLHAGWQVIAAGRRQSALDSLAGQGAVPAAFDVTDHEGLQQAVGSAVAKVGYQLDGLVNAAGYGLYGSVESTAIDQARHQLEVNVLGLAAVTKVALPYLRKTPSPRIVNISSVAGRMTTPLAGWYAASKYAVEALSDALRSELHDQGIHVCIIEPGAITTGFDAIAMESLRQEQDPRYQHLVQGMEKLVTDSFATAPGPEVVADTVLTALTARRPKTRYPVPMQARTFLAAKAILSDRAFDAVLRSQLRAGLQEGRDEKESA